MSATSEFAIAPLRAEDAVALAGLHQQVMGEADGWSTPGLARLLGASAARGFQASADGKLAAFVLAFAAADEAEILALCVSPAHRRQGLARTLLRRLGELLAGEKATLLHLEVRQSNLEARQLYAHCGFAKTGRRKTYYGATDKGPTEDAVLMSRSLMDYRA